MTNPLFHNLHFKSLPGNPFLPSNGEEGEAFEIAFCFNCTKEDEEHFCNIHTSVFLGERPTEWIHDVDGIPCCTEWERRENDAS